MAKSTAKIAVPITRPRDTSPLFDMLEQRLLSCLDINGSINMSEIARRTGFSRQSVYETLITGYLSPSLAYYMLERMDHEINLDDVRPFVRRSLRSSTNKA